MTEIVINLSSTEMRYLREKAAHELRHPRDQARYMLRSVLLGGALSTDANAEHVAVPSPATTPEPLFSP